MFVPLDLPPAVLRVEKNEVFDIIRKKLVHLTPEEWVRQHIIHFLISHKNFPAGLIEVEKTIKVFNTTKRVDILVRTPQLKPLLLVECKAPGVAITRREAEQMARYQITLQADLSFLSNGNQHVVMQHNAGKIEYLPELPAYSKPAF
jgi:hypothetical protein